MELELLQHQIDFIEDFTTPFLGLVGGYRSGKTYCLCVKAIHMASINSKADGAILEPTYGMITRVLIPTMNTLLYQLKIPFNLNKSDGYYDLQLGKDTKRIWLLSAENYMRAAGMTLSWFGIDEVDLMKLDVATASFNMMTSRLTVGENIQSFVCSTPEGYNFLYEFFEENCAADRRLIRASTYDNPFVDTIYFENMKKTHTSKQLEAYLYGHFVNMTDGNVYYSFERSKHHTNKTMNEYPNHIIHCGSDFNVGQYATPIGIIDKDVIYLLDEISNGRNTEDTIQIIKNRYPGRQIMVYPDASGGDSFKTAVSDVKLFKDAGFEVYNRTKNPRIKDRVASVNAKLLNSKDKVGMFINTTICKSTTKTLEQQGFVNGIPDKTSGLDHMGDALGYFVYFRYPLQGQSSITSIG